MLAELHRATPAVSSVARRIDLELPGRDRLESALEEVNQPWGGGPFSEPARRAVAKHASEVAELLALADRLALDVSKTTADWVVTHGEPHARNVMRTNEGLMLIDWDTVGLAPPERDLWMVLGDDGNGATSYGNATGHDVDEVAVSFFRLGWDLTDLIDYLNVLRSPHRHNGDTVRAYKAVTACVAIRPHWAGLLE
jgi:spectinomycin phosphotransferase